MVGHNTDGRGFVSALEEDLSFHPRRKRVVLLGAGGAARGIGVALGAAGVLELTVLNRTPRRASGLARHLRKIFKGVRVSWSALGTESAARAFEQADLLVNASAVGMGGTSHRGLPLAVLPKHAIVSDIVYRPLRTPLLASASKLGLRTQGGLGMLLHQGAEAFTLWTGQPAPVAAMKRALRQALLRNTPP